MPVALIAFHLPYETLPWPEDRTFHLYISGINFTLWAGTRIPPDVGMACLSKKPHYALLYDAAPQIARRYKEAYADAKKSRKLKVK